MFCVLIYKTIVLTEQIQSITKIDFNNFIDCNILQHSDIYSISSEIKDAITDIIDSYNINWLPFIYFTVCKKYIIKVACQKYKNLIAVLNLIILLRVYNPNKFIFDCIDFLFLWTKIETNKQQILLKLIARYCYQLDLENFRSFFINITVKKQRKKLFQF